MRVKKFVKLIRNEEGSGLILALMTLMVLSILGAALGAITIGSYKLGDVNRDDNSAYYIAEAGARLAYEEFSVKVMNSYSENNIQDDFFTKTLEIATEFDGRYDDFSYQFGKKPTATARIEIIEIEKGNPQQYILKSTGIIGDKQRTVEMPLKVNWIGKGIGGSLPAVPANMPSLAKNRIEINDNSEVIGDVYFDKEVEYTFINKGLHNGDLVEAYILWSQYEKVIEDFPFKETLTYGTKSFDSNGNIDVNSNTYFEGQMNFSKKKYEIDTNDKDVYIITDDLVVSNNTQIEVKGKGSVNFLVTNSLSIGQNAEFNQENIRNKLNLLYSGNTEVFIPNNVEFNGSFFIENASLVVRNNANITGVILTGGKNVRFDNNSSGKYVIVAPYASIIFEKAEIFGSVIADTFILNNGAKLEYQEFDLSDYPFGSVSKEDALVDFPSGTEVSIEDIIKAEPGIEN